VSGVVVVAVVVDVEIGDEVLCVEEEVVLVLVVFNVTRVDEVVFFTEVVLVVVFGVE
jgi:hypothetical protein